jgi:hypothetical protein
MTRAKDISKIVTDANLSGTLDVTGAFTSQGIDDNANAVAITIDSSENVGIGTSSPHSIINAQGSGTAGAVLTLENSNTALSSGNTLGSIEFYSNDASTNANGVRAKINANASSASGATDIIFSNTVSADTTLVERMRIDSSGRVMIGTTTEGAANEAEELTIAGTGGVGMTIRSTDSGTSRIYFSDGTSGTPEYAGYQIYNHSSNAMIFGTNATERMRIDSSGHLLVGTTTEGEASGDDLTIATTGNTGITIRSGTTGSGQVYFSDGTSGADEYRGYIQYQHSQNALIFGTNAQERMRIDSSGNVMIGTTITGNAGGITMLPNNSNGAGTIVFDRSSTSNISTVLGFENGNSSVGSITHGSGGTNFNTTSDHRLKENVEDMTGAIDRVKLLLPKRFNFIADSDTTVDGFLAHEAQTVVAEAVIGTHNEVDDDGNPVMQGIDQAKIVPLLTGALKEAIAKIEELEARIVALETA